MLTFLGSTEVLTGEYYSTAVKVLKYCKGSTDGSEESYTKPVNLIYQERVQERSIHFTNVTEY